MRARVLTLVSLLVLAGVACNDLPPDPSAVPYVAAPISGLHPHTVAPSFTAPEHARKICQLIGDADHADGRPLPDPTAQRFGVLGTDLGISVERNGELYFLFGDTWSSDWLSRPEGADAFARMYGGKSAMDACRELSFPTELHDYGFTPLTLDGHTLPTYQVATGAFSTARHLWAFFTVADADGFTIGEGGGRGVMAYSDRDGAFVTYRDVSPTGDRFNMVAATTVAGGTLPELPDAWGKLDDVLLFGTGRYRQSYPRLAIAQRNHPQKAWIYFAGFDAKNEPAWTPNEESSMPLFLDNPSQACVGEMSATYAPDIASWVMTYNCRGKILARTAPKPWGPWSGPITIFDKRLDGYGAFVHHPCGVDSAPCGDDAYSPPRDDHFGPNESGDVYAPYLVPRWFWSDRPGREHLVFTMSTWNPYTSVLMDAPIDLPPASSR